MRVLKLISFLIAVCTVLCLVGCKSQAPTSDELNNISDITSTDFDPNPSSETPTEQVESVNNPLTGEKTLNPDRAGVKPVAVMINNLDIAQPVQAGLDQADVVYETEVEGGITRLMAVYSDITAVGTIGTVRSARVVFTDLACGMNAVFVHCGLDPEYCAAHLGSISLSRIDLQQASGYSFRSSNGLASEHTLYTRGTSLQQAISDGKIKNTASSENWLAFADEGESVTLSGGAASSVSVSFSTGYTTQFLYDENSGKYSRAKNSAVMKDYVSGNAEQFKNVFVLKTTMSFYADGKHRQVSLSGGRGYYISGGSYEEIKWTKGSSSSPLTFTKTDGSELKVNAGNSYICIINSSQNISVQ